MDIFLVIFSAVFLIVFYAVHLKSNQIEKAHQQEVLQLKNIISELLLIQKQQNGALELSQQLKIKLQDSRVIIDNKMLNLQNELISKLVENNLID